MLRRACLSAMGGLLCRTLMLFALVASLGGCADDKIASVQEQAAADVCRSGCRFSDLSSAVMATEPEGTVKVAPGRYETCAVIQKPILLIGLKDASGKRAHLAGRACEEKGALVVRASNVTIQGFEISDISVRHRNGACVRIDPEAGDVVIRDLYCRDSENGVLGGPRNGSILIENSVFDRNGANRGRAHGLYITRGNEFILRNSQILSTKGLGHSLKTGAERTIIEGSIIAALEGNNSRAVDAYGGGEVVIQRSVIHQGKNSDNKEALGIALEKGRINSGPHSTTLEDNWIIFDDPERCCHLIFRANKLGPLTLRRNKIVAMTNFSEPVLDLETKENEFYSDRRHAKLAEYDGTLSALPRPGATTDRDSSDMLSHGLLNSSERPSDSLKIRETLRAGLSGPLAERGLQAGVVGAELGEFVAERREGRIQFFEGEALGNVLGAVPVEGLDRDHHRALRARLVAFDVKPGD